MYGIASTTADLGTLYTNTGTVIGYSITIILLGGIALLGLGFAWRHLKKYITGHKF